MTPLLFLERCVEPGLALLPGYMTRDEARVMLVAIAGQETNWAARKQLGQGTALSYLQFERIGVAEVMQKLPHLARQGLDTNDIPVASAFAALQYHDPVACAFGRLLLWSDPDPLPAIGEQDAAWEYYLRLWKPGKRRPADWPGNYQKAVGVVKPAPASPPAPVAAAPSIWPAPQFVHSLAPPPPSLGLEGLGVPPAPSDVP